MHTSRLARQTERVMHALHDSPDLATRRSSRRTRQATIPDVDDDTNDPDGPRQASTQQIAAAKTSSRKRKRDAQEKTLSPQVIKLESTTESPRRSPRKDIKTREDSTIDSDSKPRKAKRQPAKRIKGADGDVTVEPPPGWDRVYNVTAEMRKKWLAPVDTMGCESLAEDTRPPLERRLQTLVALMLSSQTKDTVTAVAMKNLQANLPGGFCLDGLLTVDPVLLNELICKVGFHNNKTKFIKQMAEILRDKFGGDIPDTIEGLVSLPGVGPKMAYLCMSAAWGRDEGIGVDVHVHRITNLWGWHKTSTPEQTRAELEAWLPREKWHDINHLLVGFGQTYCPPVGRKCQDCELYTLRLCPSAVPSSPVKKKAKREIEIKLENSEVVDHAETVVEYDDVGVKIEISSLDTGNVLLQGRADSKSPNNLM